jgi:hypothetical protein
MLVALLATTGCTNTARDNRAMLCEVFVEAAYQVATTKSDVPPGPEDPQPLPKKCCSECKDTGKVKSGDKLSWVDCECDKSCGCHGTKQLIREVK